MAHDVFISYSARDKAVADAVVAGLETRGVRCWIAPRNMMPGASWMSEILQAIRGSKAFVLVLSSGYVSSAQSMREVVAAYESGVRIIPFRIEDVQAGRDMEFFATSIPWVDATTPPLEQHIDRLYLGVQDLLGAGSLGRSDGREPSPAEEVPYPREGPSFARRLAELFRSIVPARRAPPSAARVPQSAQAGEEPPRSGSKGYIFISYAREDADFVDGLRELLRAKGYAYWDYTAGERDYHGALYRELEERIYNAAAFIAIVSDDWRHSDWVASEFTYARDANKPIFVIQAKRMARPFPILLNLQTRIDMSESSEQGRQTLLLELAKKGL